MAEKITVALELDGRKYTAELDRAKNATANFTQQAGNQVKNTANEFGNLDKSVGKLAAAFGRLKNILIGAAFVGLARSAVALADEIKDLSSATGIAIDDIIKFQNALAQSGKSADMALQGLTTLQQKIAEARDGSSEAQEMFGKLGVSLDDLRGSDQGVMLQAIKGVKDLKSESEKTAATMDLLGKAGRGLTIDDNFLGILQEGTNLTQQQTKAIEDAARLNDQFAESFTKIRLAFLEAFNPVIEGVAKLLKDMPSLITAFKILGAVIVATFVASGIRAFIGFVAATARGVVLLANGLRSLIGLVRSAPKAAGGATRDAATLLSGRGPKTPLGKARDVAGGVAGLAAGGLIAKEAFFSDADTESANKMSDGVKKVTDNVVKLSKETLSALKSIREIGEEFANNADKAIQSAEAEGRMLTMTDQQKEKYKATQRVIEEMQTAVDRLNDKKIAGNKAVNAAIDEEIDKIQIRAQDEIEALDQILTRNQEIEKSIKEQLKSHERIYDMTQKVKDIQDNYALDSLVGIERELKQIEIAERKVADAAKYRIEQETMNLPQGERERIIAEETQKINQAMEESVRIQSDAAKKGYEESRTWSRGWNKAMKEYVENATNAAKRAQDVFTTATQNMEEAIVQFAKTGKFEWRSFVSSIVEELLRQQVRELIAKTFGGMSQPASGGGGGGGGLFGAIGSLLGFANGGIIPTNGPVIVGERGPELLMGARGSQVVPNNQLGGTTNVVYNINAVDAASFKQMIAKDPSFIYAVSQQGAKSIPSTRR